MMSVHSSRRSILSLAMRACVRLAFTVFLLQALPGAASECERPGRLRFSLVPQGDVREDVAAMKPLFDALQAALGIPVEVVHPSSYGAVIEGLLAGAVDLALVGPAAYITAKRQDGRITAFATLATKKEFFQEEGAYYASLLIVRASSPFASIASLQGKKLALVDPGSTSGAKIPRYAFAQLLNVPFEQHFSRVAYSGGHHMAALAVLNGQVDAAFVASSNLSAFVAKGQARQEDFRVIWRSAPIPHDPFVYRGQLCEDIKQKIRASFLAMGRTQQQGDDGQSPVPAFRADRRQRLPDIARFALKFIGSVF